MSAQPTHEIQVTVASIDLLAGALRSLDTSIIASRAGEKYVAAHLAALRAAAALLAAYTKPNRSRPTSVWTLVSKVAPEFTEWAQYFAAGAGKRAAAEVGLGGAVTPREADDLVRDAHEFIDLVAEKLGVSRQLTLPTNVAAQNVIPNNVIQLNRRTVSKSNPAVSIPAVSIPAVSIPAVSIPAVSIPAVSNSAASNPK